MRATWFKPLLKAAPEMSPVQVFEGFVEVAFLCLLGKREEALALPLTAGKPERLEVVIYALTELGEVMERHRFEDVLGEVHQEIRGMVSMQNTGSFYTPTCVCEAMAQMVTGVPDETEQALREKAAAGDVFRVADPTVGAGRTLMAFAKEHEEYLLFIRFHGTDIEANACRMAFLNFALNGMAAEVVHGNELTQEVWHVYRTPEWEVYDAELAARRNMLRIMTVLKGLEERPQEPRQGEFDFMIRQEER